MKLHNSLSALAPALLVLQLFQVAPVNGKNQKDNGSGVGNELFCAGLSFAGAIFAPLLTTLVFEEVQDQLTYNLPMNGGTFAVNEPGEPTFSGCTFNLPVKMGLDTPVLDINDAATITLEGTVQPASFLTGFMCLEDVQVVDYGIDSIPQLPMLEDILFGGEMPTVSVSEQSCVSLLDTLRILLGMGANENSGGKRMLRQRETHSDLDVDVY